MAARNGGLQTQRPMAFRIGVHLGDVVVAGDDLYGDGVNVASRLEGIAESGGICISRQVYDQVRRKLTLGYRSLGPRILKNIPDTVDAFTIQGDGLAITDEHQEIRYCRTADGVRLAYAISGRGPPLVKPGNWLNHLEYDWESPFLGHFFVGLSRRFRLIRHDPRGTGLSDWEVPDISLEAWVSDLAAVVDAAGVERFPLLGYSQGCAVAIAYTAQHPERVSHLVLLGGFAQGAGKLTPEAAERHKALATLMRLEWGADNPAFRQMFATRMMPGASKVQVETFGDWQRKTCSGECAARYLEATGNFDVLGLLPELRVPTLVMHVRDDAQISLERGRQLATRIPGAKFVVLQGKNHILLEQDPATQRFFEEIALFLQSESSR